MAMEFQRTMSVEDYVAETMRANLRVIRPQHTVHEVEMQRYHTQPASVPSKPERKMVTLTPEENTYNWFRRMLNQFWRSLKCQKTLFGTLSFEVPIKECDPDLLEKFLIKNNVRILNRVVRYNLKTGEAISEIFTCDTPECGILNTI